MFKVNENIVLRKIHGTYFLIDITDNYKEDKCSLYEINQTGTFLWENLANAKDSSELAALLKAAIIDDVDFEIIKNDVDDFVAALRERNFIISR